MCFPRDRFYLQNHRNASCKTDYNPQNRKDMYPGANFMVVVIGNLGSSDLRGESLFEE